MFMQIETNCAECGKSFNREKGEHTRSVLLKRNEFCSRKCSTIYRNKHLSLEEKKKCYNISRHANNRRDEYSSFRLYLNKGRYSMKKHPSDIDVQYLKELWDKQSGICPYTGIKMLLPETSADYSLRSLKKASLDRIDCSKDYIKGNVEFVCFAINLAKNSFTREEMKEFIAEIGGPAG